MHFPLSFIFYVANKSIYFQNQMKILRWERVLKECGMEPKLGRIEINGSLTKKTTEQEKTLLIESQ